MTSGLSCGKRIQIASRFSSKVPVRSAKAKSLRTLVDGERYPDIKWGIKLARGNVGFADGILTLPHWSAFLLKRLMAGGSIRLKK